MVFVTKFDGTKQKFDKNKIVNTCLRNGSSRKVAEAIAEEVEMRIYDGIETRKILQMTFRLLSKYKPSVKNQIDLRKALALMRSAPDFERFIQLLFSEHGYKVVSNRIVKGRCIEHEVDAIVTRDNKTFIVEVKHHMNYHSPTGLDVSRIARAVFEDLTEGFELGFNTIKIDGAIIVCNTKLSGHAKRYAECRGIGHIGWSSPPKRDLQTLIEEKKLYLITYLKGLSISDRKKLASKGILVLKQLIRMEPEELRKQSGISPKILKDLVGKAKSILSGNLND